MRPDDSTTSKEQPSISLNEKYENDDDEEGEVHRHGSKERDSKNSSTKKDILLIHEEESTNETNEQKICTNTNNNIYSPSSKFSIIKQNRLVKFSRNCYSNFNNNKSNKRPKIERLSHTEILARKKQYSALLAELCRQYGTISGAELVAPTVKMSRQLSRHLLQLNRFYSKHRKFYLLIIQPD
uniref:Uncharacterized protein n=1 Tax=Romanomermis culicivorax TaxID=13658 RepID=A0A915JEP9_ROMCU